MDRWPIPCQLLLAQPIKEKRRPHSFLLTQRSRTKPSNSPTILSASTSPALLSHLTTLSTIPNFNLTKLQQAQLQSYMTTFHDQITSFPSSVSSFETTSTFDLFHFPENDFKDAHRQRAQRIQKNRERSAATVNYLLRRSTAASSEDLTIQRKVELRLKNGNNSSNSNSSSDELEQDLGDKRKKDKKNHSSTKQQRHGATQLSQLVDANRSNKRADRRNKLSEEEVLQLQQHKYHQQQDDQESDEDTGYSSGGSSSSGSSIHRGRGGRRHGKGQVLEAEERIRFKHNLVFAKGNDDDGTMAAKRIDAQSFQKVFEKKLDEKDQIRSNKHTSRR